ncbi:transglycosylase SLT domain-containing protein [Marivita sp.]|uniref:transglycosylase SLT domain-containing protein n=1 Tax=Marivita sp. TaxID=2003365 RepID=UPI003F4AD9CC
MLTGILVKSILSGVLVAALAATNAGASLCDSAAQRASSETGVPLDVMLTITRLETGRGKGVDPWPWTVNHAGDGSWFPSEDDARSYVFSKIKRGASNIDIGCFQINYRWHADGFRSLDDMFNPDLNALYAANFLNQLYREFGTWTEAVGAYHSRTPEFAERYKSKFHTLRGRVATLDVPEPKALKPNRKLVFGRQGTARPGSAFLTDATGAQPFIPLNRTN